MSLAAITDHDRALFDRVRTVRVHHPHGGYVPAAIGWYDRLGYARCLTCPPAEDRGADAIMADNSAAGGERCDFCGASVHEAALTAHGAMPEPARCGIPGSHSAHGQGPERCSGWRYLTGTRS